MLGRFACDWFKNTSIETFVDLYRALPQIKNFIAFINTFIPPPPLNITASICSVLTFKHLISEIKVLSPVHAKNDKDNDISVHTSERYHL